MSNMFERIDSHTHVHTLPWDHLDLLAATGLRCAIATAGNPHVHNQFFKAALTPENIFGLWDDPIHFASHIERTHFFKVKVVVGIHSLARPADPMKTLEKMPDYLKNPHVVGVGEVGLDPIQYFGLDWPLESQAEVLAEQCRIAKKFNKPVVMHTPTYKSKSEFLTDLNLPILNKNRNYKESFIEWDLKIVDEVGLDHKLLVLDHIDDTVIDYALEASQAMLGISVGLGMRDIRPKDVAKIVEKHGPDRIMINSDIVSHVSYDPLSIPKVILEMRRIGLSEKIIRQVVFDNANKFYGLNMQ